MRVKDTKMIQPAKIEKNVYESNGDVVVKRLQSIKINYQTLTVSDSESEKDKNFQEIVDGPKIREGNLGS